MIIELLKLTTAMAKGREGARKREIVICFESLGTNTKLSSLFLVAIEIEVGFSNFS
jgi:hypothetical protein